MTETDDARVDDEYRRDDGSGNARRDTVSDLMASARSPGSSLYKTSEAHRDIVSVVTTNLMSEVERILPLNKLSLKILFRKFRVALGEVKERKPISLKSLRAQLYTPEWRELENEESDLVKALQWGSNNPA